MNEKIFSGANHFSITVGDIDKSVKFYKEVMEMEFENIRYNVDLDYIRKVTGYPDGVLNVAFLGCLGLRLELIQYVEPKGKVLDVRPHNVCSSHICFTTTDIFKAYERCKANNIKTVNKPTLIDSGPSTGAYAFYLLDPDNYNLEMFQPAKVQK
ncbi:VOC family protein [Clostridium thailandense]|uniref:VOC family protein n=1 Tax=Clostridium thailandense TaxID=2794346 RepID=A0A949TVX8_9CLOT|nr:VOC family protein [Clostridium thailandense]MBV7273443.1 VOC family protein [Clostridium thailandense]